IGPIALIASGAAGSGIGRSPAVGGAAGRIGPQQKRRQSRRAGTAECQHGGCQKRGAPSHGLPPNRKCGRCPVGHTAWRRCAAKNTPPTWISGKDEQICFLGGRTTL